jgi:hypothetical protein
MPDHWHRAVRPWGDCELSLFVGCLGRNLGHHTGRRNGNVQRLPRFGSVLNCKWSAPAASVRPGHFSHAPPIYDTTRVSAELTRGGEGGFRRRDAVLSSYARSKESSKIFSEFRESLKSA